MKKLIEKYQQPSSTLDWWNQHEHNQVNGKTLYKFVVPETGQIRWVDPTDSAIFEEGKRGYAWYDDDGNPSGRYTRIEGDPNPAPIHQQDVQLQHLKDKAEADRITAARTDGLEDLVLPWNWTGYAFNNTVGKAFQYLPESVQKIISYGKYITPSYLIGGDELIGTSTGTTFDFMSAPLVVKGVRNTPYVAAAQKFNQPLRNWGRAKVVSRMIDEGAQDVYGGPAPLWKALLTRTKPEEVEDPYPAIFEKYSKTAPPRFYSYNGGYVRPQVRTGA